MRLPTPRRAYVLWFLAGLLIYGAMAGSRLTKQSPDPHFVYLADAWLHGKLAIDPAPKRGDDWASLEVVELKDGRRVAGRRMVTQPLFQIAGGGTVPRKAIRRRVGKTYHVSFPPVPALLMVPGAALHGRAANDVIPTVLLAALMLPLAFGTLRRAVMLGLSARTPRENHWLVAALGFGTVMFFCAVQGRVWFTAHVVGVTLALAYAWCAMGARHPIAAGVLLGLATLTRTPMAFMFPLLALEAWRVRGERPLLPTLLKFAAPVLAIAAIAMAYNQARWGSPIEFGHSYLAVRQQQRMELSGLFSFDYLRRNLAVLFALVPRVSQSAPFVQISGHGMALWLVSPFLLLTLWPKRMTAFAKTLAVTALVVAIPSLFYQNSGWFQFGPRFCLDYMPFLILLIAVGGRPLAILPKTLIAISIAINTFGAWSFARHHQYYDTSKAAYDIVLRH